MPASPAASPRRTALSTLRARMQAQQVLLHGGGVALAPGLGLVHEQAQAQALGARRLAGALRSATAEQLEAAEAAAVALEAEMAGPGEARGEASGGVQDEEDVGLVVAPTRAASVPATASALLAASLKRSGGSRKSPAVAAALARRTPASSQRRAVVGSGYGQHKAGARPPASKSPAEAAAAHEDPLAPLSVRGRASRSAWAR